MRLGANYLNYDFTPDGQGYGFGVIAAFHVGRAKIQAQLTQMAAWAKFIRLCIFTEVGSVDGMNLDITGAHFTQQQTQNFKDLLSMIRDTGFEQVEVTLCPQASEAPQNWTAWSQPNFDLFSALVYYALADPLSKSGLDWKIDLQNEMGSPHKDWGTKDLMIEYVANLYGYCRAALGTTIAQQNTAGSSMDPALWGIQQIPRLYGSDPKDWPRQLDVHIYRGVPSEGWLSAAETFLQVDKALTAIGYAGPLGLPEFPFNPETYLELLLAIKQSKREVPTLAYWPAKYWLACPNAVNFIPGEALMLPPGNEGLLAA